MSVSPLSQGPRELPESKVGGIPALGLRESGGVEEGRRGRHGAGTCPGQTSGGE